MVNPVTHTHNYEGMYYQNHKENYHSDFDAYHLNSHFHPNFSWENDFVAQPHEHFLSQPQSFQTNEGSTFDAYQPPHGSSLEDTFNLFMQGQMEIFTQMSKCQEHTIRVTEDIRNQLTQLTQTLSMSEPVHPNSLQIPLIKPIIKSESQEQDIGVTVLRNGEIIEKLDAPRTVHHLVQEERVVDHSEVDVNEALEEEKDQNDVRKEETWEEEEDKIREPKCEKIISLSTFTPQFLSFRLVDIIEDQIKPNTCEMFVQINVPYADIIKPTPPDDIFSKYICAFMRKINLYNFENNFKSGVVNGRYYTIRWATTYLILNWKKRKKKF
ncbi:uncharacterized protein LOC127798984 [Diospyros lotus]|uniref:uncharacterized protein LOC127798984 n=1 Tax=Diospyros lotus TaxID=55363 RepID=UPI00225297B2|nr:uncharacterized protein LOC127798984 [Diospyros lotus]XP_052188608.1 uncharacterized protein LOC127798984 [Diospyros lotus]